MSRTLAYLLQDVHNVENGISWRASADDVLRRAFSKCRRSKSECYSQSLIDATHEALAILRGDKPDPR